MKNYRTRLLRIIVIVSLALCLICVNVFAYSLNGHHIENKITFVPYEKFGATVIVKATALPGSQVIEVAPASGGDSRNFTNYTFSVSDCLFGDIAQGSHITVRVEGGRNANQNTVCLESPVISSGQEVILFLQKNDLGGGYATSDDYYRILGVNQGIFYPSNISGNCFTNISNESISISTILNSIKNKSTVYQGSGSSYSELQKNLQVSVSNGVISPADCQDILNSSRSYGYVIN